MLLSDERPNGELAMVTGIIPDTNMSDFLTFPAELLQADKYYMMKSQILESMGFSAKVRKRGNLQRRRARGSLEREGRMGGPSARECRGGPLQGCHP